MIEIATPSARNDSLPFHRHQASLPRHCEADEVGRSNHGGAVLWAEIATPRQVGARNDTYYVIARS
jgi:hypothetical protein